MEEKPYLSQCVSLLSVEMGSGRTVVNELKQSRGISSRGKTWQSFGCDTEVGVKGRLLI